MYGYIYVVTNLITQKMYVGKHKYSKPELDPKYFASGKIINESLSTYGKESFSQKLIDVADSLEELNRKEIFWIKELNTRCPNGYNLTDGGDGAPNLTAESRKKLAYWQGKKQSEETKQKRIESLKQVEHNPEWVAKISKSLRGKKPSEAARINSGKATKERVTGSHWYNNGVHMCQYKENEVPEGYIRGVIDTPARHFKKSEQQKIKNGLAHKDAIWVNNGLEERMIKGPIPEGFVCGRLPKKKPGYAPNKGKVIYNNGIISIYIGIDEPIPEGFIKGRCPKNTQ